MIELGMKDEIFGADDLVLLSISGRPTSMPRVQDGHQVICGYNQGLGERVIVCESFEDMQTLYDAYSQGSALTIRWYSGPDPGFVAVLVTEERPSSPELKVTSVTSRGESATFEFADGHRVVLEGYSHGFGFQVEGLRHFYLFNGDAQVVRYDSRLYYAGPRDDEHRFVEVAEGYDLERIAAYWEAARNHVNEEYFNKPHREGRQGDKKLWFPWKLSGEGWLDLSAIKEGRTELPSPTSS